MIDIEGLAGLLPMPSFNDEQPESGDSSHSLISEGLSGKRSVVAHLTLAFFVLLLIQTIAASDL